MSKRYQSDLTDKQWSIIEPLIPAEKDGGRPRSTDMREVMNAIFYMLRRRCFLTPRSVFFHKIQADRRLLGIPSDVILLSAPLAIIASCCWREKSRACIASLKVRW